MSANAGVGFGYNTANIPLYTSGNSPSGYVTIGNTAVVTYSNVANVGTDVIVSTNGNIALVGNVSYNLIATAASGGPSYSSGINGATLQFFNATANAYIGVAQTFDAMPLIVTFTPNVNSTLQLVLTGRGGNKFQYPDTLTGATVQAIEVNG